MRNKKINNDNEISQLCTVTLGGYEQKILIEGKEKSNPIIITLHGGPGTPIPFSVGCRGLFPIFTDSFIMVYWDQLGCGINNYVIDNTFTIDLFVKMTEDLVEYIKEKFPNNKILIFSTSWGTILSSKLLERNPKIVNGVIACGQIIKNVFISDEIKNILAEKNIPKNKLKKINNLTVENITKKDLVVLTKLLRKYTDAYQNKIGAKAPTLSIIKGLLISPDYKFKDFKALIINGYLKNMSLWNEILKIDLTDQLQDVKIPYIILQGDTDIISSTRLVEKLVDESNNSNLECIVVENTGHIPGVLMMDTILKVLEKMSR